MIRLGLALQLAAAPAAAQQRALVVEKFDDLVIAPRGAVQPPRGTASPMSDAVPRARLAPQGPPPLVGRGVGEWVTSPWLLAPLAAAAALAVLLPGGGGAAPSAGAGLGAGAGTVAR